MNTNQNFDNKKTLNDIYKKLLKRNVDIEGMNFFLSLLDHKLISINEIEKRIIESQEYRFLHNIFTPPTLKKTKHSLYFELCKRILTDTLPDESLRRRFFDNPKQISDSDIENGLKGIVDVYSVKEHPGKIRFSELKRAHTMIGMLRLNNLQFCVEDVLENNIDGDLLEAGVWKGGACIFMKKILEKYEIKNKKIYVADSFEGLPKANVKKYPKDASNKDLHKMKFVKVKINEVKKNFEDYGVLDNNVKFLKGWFKDTTKNPPFKKLCILRLDGDMYSSTWEVLENLYNKLSIGGYLIVDDYALHGCQSAVNDFREKYDINESLIKIDWSGVYWKKTK